MIRSFFFFVYLLFFLFCKDKNEHDFSKGLKPITINGEIQSSGNCKDCHKEIYSEWKKSRHSVSFTNRLYTESFEKEPLAWCTNCHAPFMKQGGNPDLIEDRILADEGISCNVCHFRNEKILTAKIPKNKKQHSYIEIPEMRKSEFCANCHQFNFLTGNSISHNLKYSSLVMQDTFSEWQTSFFYERESCQDCHLPKMKNHKTHSFSGGHDSEFLSKTFEVDLKKISSTSFELNLHSKNIGHSFPTGDFFRKLVLSIQDKNGNEIYRIEFKYEYENIEENKNSTTESVKKLISKNILPPPIYSNESNYKKIISLQKEKIQKIYFIVLSMNFQEETNSIFTKQEDDYTKLQFKRVKVKL